jgi:hypothetical protein
MVKYIITPSVFTIVNDDGKERNILINETQYAQLCSDGFNLIASQGYMEGGSRKEAQDKFHITVEVILANAGRSLIKPIYQYVQEMIERVHGPNIK